METPRVGVVFPDERRHYVTLFVVARSRAGEAVVREPAKCVQWVWRRWSELPEPLFAPLASLRRSGFVPTMPPDR